MEVASGGSKRRINEAPGLGVLNSSAPLRFPRDVLTENRGANAATMSYLAQT
jgi:hypothetical protein